MCYVIGVDGEKWPRKINLRYFEKKFGGSDIWAYLCTIIKKRGPRVRASNRKV